MADFLCIKDYEKYQRYKDRRPPWIKVYRSILDDMELMSLPAESFRLLVLLWLMASECENRISREAARWRLRVENGTFEDALAPLLHTGHVQEVCK